MPPPLSLWHIIGMDATKRFSACHRPGQDVSAIARAATASAREFAAGCGIHPPVSSRLAVIVEELVGNLLRHGRAPCDVQLELILTRLDGEVIVVLEDNCLPFDPRLAHFAGPDGQGGGVGLAVVRGFSDILGYERAGGVNRLTLRVRR